MATTFHRTVFKLASDRALCCSCLAELSANVNLALKALREDPELQEDPELESTIQQVKDLQAYLLEQECINV